MLKVAPAWPVVQIGVAANTQTLASGTDAAEPDGAASIDAVAERRSPLVVTARAESAVVISQAPHPARERASFPTVDAAGGLPVTEALDLAAADLFAALPEGMLGVTAEHRGRYAAAKDGELGRGGMGRVYVAADRHLDREVAIKELLLDRTDEERPGALQTLVRFLREARITGKLEHPNIVPVHELGRRADGSLYYTMRVVRGRTLSRALARPRRSPGVFR